jgi:hypothetical protein
VDIIATDCRVSSNKQQHHCSQEHRPALPHGVQHNLQGRRRQ